MARRLRIQFPGAIYHVLNRGDRRELVFLNDDDRVRFIETLGEACEKTGWQVHAFVLMPNHFHLVVETPQPNLAAGMKWFLGSYTARFNRRHGLSGHLFSGRYKSFLVGGEGGYLRTVVDYVHLNPVRARMLQAAQAVKDFRWSSLPLYLAVPQQRPAWLRVDRAFGECGIHADSPAARQAFEQRLEGRRMQELEGEFQTLRHDWCFGEESFRRELLEQSEAQIGRHHYGPEVQESAEEKAERIVREELAKLGWLEDELRTRAKGDDAKVRIAKQLRAETTMTLEWIAGRLRMGTKGHLTHLLFWRGKRRGRSMVSNTGGNERKRQPRVAARTSASNQPRMPIPLTDPVTEFDASFD